MAETTTSTALEAKTLDGILQVQEGVLMFKKWKPHWVKVDGNHLLIYKVQSDSQPRHKISLTQSYVANLDEETATERENAFVIKSANGDEMSLKCSSTEEVKQWIMTIKINARILDIKLMHDLTQPKPFEGFKGKVLKMGWIHERLTGVPNWHWKYMVMTDCDLLFFDKAPSTSPQLGHPSVYLHLFECKQRQTPPSQNEKDARKYSFLLMSHLPAVLISTETRMELTNWLNALKATTMNALHAAPEFKYPVTFEGQLATLVIKRNEGFSLHLGKDNTQAWHYQTSQFKSVRVSGRSSTLFDFGKFSDRVLDVQSPDNVRISILASSVMDYLTFASSMNAAKQLPEDSKRVSGQNTPTGSQEAADRGGF